jgi:hypothetical protein
MIYDAQYLNYEWLIGPEIANVSGAPALADRWPRAFSLIEKETDNYRAKTPRLFIF